LNIDDDVRFTQIFTQPCILAEKFLGLPLPWDCAWTFGPRFLASQGFKDSFGPALAANKSAETSTDFAAGRAPRPLRVAKQQIPRLQQDALLIFSGVGTPLGFGYHLRIGPRSTQRIGARFGLPLHSAAARREASLRSVPRQPNPQERTTPNSPSNSLSASFALLLIN